MNSNPKKYESIRWNDDVYEGEKISEKGKVLEYLKKYHKFENMHLFTSSPFVDRKTKEVVKKTTDGSFTDGKYEWLESDIYHIEKYNMPLKPDFINHVLKQSNEHHAE